MMMRQSSGNDATPVERTRGPIFVTDNQGVVVGVSGTADFGEWWARRMLLGVGVPMV